MSFVKHRHRGQTTFRPYWLSALTYLTLAAAGAAFLLLPTTGLKELLGVFGFVVWNLMLLGGGLLSFYGSFTKKHWFEVIGLPGVTTALFVYGIYIGFAVTRSDNPGVVLGLSLICVGAAFSGVGRLYEVYGLVRARENREVNGR
jgi:hypothetical protein